MTSQAVRFFGIFLAMLVAIPHADGGEKEIQRFRTEYPPACARIQDAYSLLSGTIQMDKEAPGAGKRRDLVKFKSAKERCLARLESGDKSGHEMVTCVRPEGQFILMRKPEDKVYSVEAIGLPAEAMFIRNVGQYLRAPYSFLGEPFDRLASDPSFRIISAETVSEGDRRGIEVTYAYGEARTPSSSTRVPPHEATFLFDPDRDWIISRGKIRLAGSPPDRAITFKVDYDAASGSIPIVTSVTYVENGRTTKCQFTSVTSVEVAPAEFSMSAFGLPDISSTQGGRKNWTPYVLASVALLAFVVAYGLRRLARSRFAASAG